MPATSTCPRCGAGVRAGSDWCTLCFADLRPVPPPRVSPDPMVVPQQFVAPAPLTALPTESAPAAAAAPPAVPAAHAQPAGSGDAQLPCPTCAAPVLLSVAVCGTCGNGLFDQLKTESPTLSLPVFGDVMAMSKGGRTALAFGFAVVATALLFLVAELVGKL